MDALLERIRTLRAELAALERGLTSGPRPERLAWVELDDRGRVLDVSPQALARLGLALDDVVGAPFGVIAETTEGDPLIDGVARLATPEGPVLVLSVGDGAGRSVILGVPGVGPSDDSAERPSRRLVHDLSNVLGIMRGRAELVAMETADAAVRRSMEEIQKAADRARGLLDEARPPV